ncbi:helix-turn-helix transcriptional regulator [Cohnella sp. AR92]|uniref:helix-turn-helix transcriptional regulator n=1 Tax=Cohnella sp. AR92 TaxID=648716 RepID=UPI000F8F19B2|nr:AraC family transcriptional regulator [Cohnella sp. AR92]RUS44975.1 AraC family transcriptional regulator [Cohnella sp. AR92]
MNIWTQNVLNRVDALIADSRSPEGLIERIKQFIQSHLDHSFSREQIGESVGLHPDYTAKLFKKETGMSITDYTAKLRIDTAKKLLVKTEMPVSAVALAVGYSNF